MDSPFLDGNGRVARLISHATLLEALDTGAVWSIARGLARNVDDYKAHLAACDLPRRNDLDGRNNLSEENMAEFTKFFLKTCIDQVAYMESQMRPNQLRAHYAVGRGGNQAWPPEQKSGAILEAVLYRGELPRADVAALVGAGDRQARRVVSALLEKGVLTSESTRANLLPLVPRCPCFTLDAWPLSRKILILRPYFRLPNRIKSSKPETCSQICAQAVSGM